MSKLRDGLVHRAAKSFRAGPRYFTPWAVDRGSHASGGPAPDCGACRWCRVLDRCGVIYAPCGVLGRQGPAEASATLRALTSSPSLRPVYHPPRACLAKPSDAVGQYELTFRFVPAVPRRPQGTCNLNPGIRFPCRSPLNYPTAWRHQVSMTLFRLRPSSFEGYRSRDSPWYNETSAHLRFWLAAPAMMQTNTDSRAPPSSLLISGRACPRRKNLPFSAIASF